MPALVSLIVGRLQLNLFLVSAFLGAAPCDLCLFRRSALQYGVHVPNHSSIRNRTYKQHHGLCFY
jgi:disulfide bond formation protein DsbB